MSLIDVENLILEVTQIENEIRDFEKKPKITEEDKEKWRKNSERYKDLMGVNYGYTINSSAAKMFKRLIEEYAK